MSGETIMLFEALIWSIPAGLIHFAAMGALYGNPFIDTLADLWLRELIPVDGLQAALILGLLFGVLRVYPRFWNMWIQSTYPMRLLRIEFVNGLIGTLVITISLELLL
jgi:hypothetical protein